MGVVPVFNGCNSTGEPPPPPPPSTQLHLSDSNSFSSQPSLSSVPSLTSHCHLPSTHSQCLATMKGHSSHVFSLALSGNSLYSSSSNAEIRLWTLPQPEPKSQNPTTSKIVAISEGAIKSIQILHHRLITAHQDHKIRVWQIDNKENRNYKLLASLPTLKDRLLRFLPPKNHVQIRRHKKRTWVHHVDAVSAIALSKDGQSLYSVSWDRTMKIWRTSDFRCTESVANAHDDAINALAISDDGFVYTASADTRIKVWKKHTGEKKHSLHATLEKHMSAVNAIALTSDGSVLYSGACDRSVVVWERGGGPGADELNGSGTHMRVVGALRGHNKAILCLAVVLDFLVCSGSADKTIRVWKREMDRSYSCLAVLEGHGGPVKCLAAAHFGSSTSSLLVYIYSGSLDCDIKVWQLLAPDLEPRLRSIG